MRTVGLMSVMVAHRGRVGYRVHPESGLAPMCAEVPPRTVRAK